MLYFKIYLLVLHLKHDFMKKVKENFYQNNRETIQHKKKYLWLLKIKMLFNGESFSVVNYHGIDYYGFFWKCLKDVFLMIRKNTWISINIITCITSKKIIGNRQLIHQQGLWSMNTHTITMDSTFDCMKIQ